MLLEFVGQSAQDGDNRADETSRLVNVYRDPAEGKFSLKGVLGQSLLADFDTAFMRDIERVGMDFYLSTGGYLRRLTEAGVKTTLGAITNHADTTISGNNGDVAVVAGGSYYVWNGTTLSNPTAGQFSDFGSCCYVDGYTVITENDGRQFCWSDLLDASTLPALNYSTTEAKDDNNLRCAEIAGNLWIFKERSAEIWYNTGRSGANAFLRLAGGVVDKGLKAYGLLADYDGGAFFVGNDNVAYRTEGAGLTPLSRAHAGVSYSIKFEEPRYCFYYEDENRRFCVITFKDRPAWCYDLDTNEWHERAEGKNDPWTAVNAVKGASDWYCGTNAGLVLKMTRNNTDYEKELQRWAVSRTLYNEQPFSIDLIEFFGRVGWSDIGRDAKCWLRMSRDGGMTWGPEKWLNLGSLGEYGKKLRRRSLGWFDERATVELNISDPAEVSFSAQAKVEIG